MNHASNLHPILSRPICKAELGPDDRQLAALLPDTRADVNCRDCRRMLGLDIAYMRVLGGAEEVPLRVEPLDNTAVICVATRGFGHLIITRDPAHPNAGTAIVTHGPGQERQAPVTRVDGRIECELLHNADRLCVVIEPAA